MPYNLLRQSSMSLHSIIPTKKHWNFISWSFGLTPRSDVVGYHHFRGPCCFHLQVVTPCNDVAGYQCFGGPCCLHLQVVTPCSDVVGYQHFGGPCYLHLQGEDQDLNLYHCGNLKSHTKLMINLCLSLLTDYPTI